MGQRKLTLEVATSIRHLYKDLGYTQSQLAYIFCVSRYVIQQILYNVTYGDAHYNPGEVPDAPLLKYYNKNIKIHYLYHNLTYEQSFKKIDDFPHYIIFIDGTIFSDYGLHYTKVKPHMENNGYMCVRLWNNNTYTSRTLHTLIATHFLENPNNLPCVLHKNDNKLDNTLENLYFGDYKDNGADAKRNGKYVHRIPQCCKDEIKKTIELLPTITNTELVRRFGIDISSVRKIKKDFENQQNQ